MFHQIDCLSLTSLAVVILCAKVVDGPRRGSGFSFKIMHGSKVRATFSHASPTFPTPIHLSGRGMSSHLEFARLHRRQLRDTQVSGIQEVQRKILPRTALLQKGPGLLCGTDLRVSQVVWMCCMAHHANHCWECGCEDNFWAALTASGNRTLMHDMACISLGNVAENIMVCRPPSTLGGNKATSWK